MQIHRATISDLDAAAPLFDAYRQFYGQRSDVAAARAFLDERLWVLNETRAKGLALATAMDNSGAQALYESCGWQRDDEFQHYYLFV